jgi:catechol 2,3-dioxygenase-like lactoylglutathione lyase family enzyme
MIDHVTLRVRDLASAKTFYAAALAPLGYAVGKDYPEAVGLGARGMLDLWLVGDAAARPQHLAFSAPTRTAVDAFHAAALAAGGSDNGPPGLRLDYHPHYYASFAIDHSGHNIEVVCHLPPAAARPAAKGARGATRKGATRKGATRKVAAGATRAATRSATRRTGSASRSATRRKIAVRRLVKGPK